MLIIYVLAGALENMIFKNYSDNVASGFYDAQMQRGVNLFSYNFSYFSNMLFFQLSYAVILTLGIWTVGGGLSFIYLGVLYAIAESLMLAFVCYIWFARMRNSVILPIILVWLVYVGY
jgi:hypothetical protein